MAKRQRKGGTQRQEKALTDEVSPTGSSKSVKFDYIKSGAFRVIHADGAHGGLTPRGDRIHISFFSERQPIPVSETYRVKSISKGVATVDLKERLNVVKRDAFVREVEVGISLDINTAESILKWLTERVKEAKTRSDAQ